MAKGTDIIYSMHAAQRERSDFGDDPDTLKPERWMDDARPLRPGWSFIPFGGGPRVCLGQQYALTQCEYVTVRLMQHFRTIECRDPEEWKEKLTFVCCSLNGVKVGLKP